MGARQFDQPDSPAVIVLCPPIGWQRVNMGRSLHERFPVFASVMHECDGACRPYLPQPLLCVLYPEAGAEDECAEMMERPIFALPALFAVQCAAFALIGCEMCQPFAVVGHSIGEFVAAVIAGTLELPSAIDLVCERSAAMEATLGGRRSHGSIISVKASAAAAQAAILSAKRECDVTVAVFNSEEQCGISGDNRALSAVVRALWPRQSVCEPLPCTRLTRLRRPYAIGCLP
jgi:acyl transferase domain-containing protein